MKSAFYVILRGPLGAGKTTISKGLAKVCNAHNISIDDILYKFNLEEWGEVYILESSFLKANEIAASESLKQLKKGVPVIIDGNFYYKSAILSLERLLKEFKGVVITLSVSIEECIRRDASRNVVLGEEATRLAFQKTTEFCFGEEVNADKNMREVLDSVVRLVEEKTEC